ncbi:hypothetical protein CSIM01_09625 [Colletotrichum simmondsii]|uniref:Uncharacterized protein n=1 Tax=Colletotrichum simmondsii TaxID=703756 RepID=A0A135TSV6_9PEZI|nr:hypothetical protein CSIM01_09625 [Colletotrichum simmondsii]
MRRRRWGQDPSRPPASAKYQSCLTQRPRLFRRIRLVRSVNIPGRGTSFCSRLRVGIGSGNYPRST